MNRESIKQRKKIDTLHPSKEKKSKPFSHIMKIKPHNFAIIHSYHTALMDKIMPEPNAF